MKLIVLVDGSISNFVSLVDLLDNPDGVMLIDTENCNAENEYQIISTEIKNFSKYSDDILLVKFSGREEVVRELGDKFPQMIVFLSYNKNNAHYTEDVPKTFRDLVNIFYKET
jgi:hypothetical protein